MLDTLNFPDYLGLLVDFSVQILIPVTNLKEVSNCSSTGSGTASAEWGNRWL
jgi:hypothetical protein